ncbi:MAG TPA: hypothetical protein DEE98_00460 [Elusimicrobia bacterium]|nr:MAG: hypothetical protein A2278_03090 [Elusimicrobia bacterium RIFOXYA12_FULL_49_49]OGS08415.1 MAG: hypothetical protein A2204_08215 [Elusimicrobia bacterium RIFOXYA1_FULL_47_7]OGS15550.1 MAG: hypothetical protein A2251_03340 [Elusimicrobia bacterium RIFOXYA2_FULL_47_53]OGS26894.1 MAG: hypothetical protein A2339_07640 [Elusimicrobia bacterium RIFOXYB12_FULL_50_12]OGS30649.1 MAG: hypothetical protein A2323_07145 [Elusimicrobia bacterium RIFOXYB2_FULL_46_23]HBU68837.1 hypothetical protein [El
MISILHVYSSWTPGGAEKVMLLLANCLEKSGVRNIIASPKNSFLFNEAVKSGLKTHSLRINGSFDPIGILKLLYIARKEHVDIIHAHQGKVFWPCIIAKLLSGGRIGVVFHRHAQLAHRFYSRGHYKIADKVIAISKAVASGLIQREKVPAGKVEVVYNGTDFDRFSGAVSGETVRKQYGLSGKTVIGTAAAMNYPKGKGQKYLIEAAKTLTAKYDNLIFLIVGTGPMLGDFKEYAKALGVADKIIFAGQQSKVEEYIAAMDIFCLLSWDTEGFGQVVVEAQALGKPVIATNVGGIPEAFEDGMGGILIEPENTAAVVEAVSKLLDNPRKASEMGRAGQSFVYKNFSLSLMVSKIGRIYQDILSAVQERK